MILQHVGLFLNQVGERCGHCLLVENKVTVVPTKAQERQKVDSDVVTLTDKCGILTRVKVVECSCTRDLQTFIVHPSIIIIINNNNTKNIIS
ncbi:hypothetical protein Pcinc_040256 [Petrolisthes cinctipes]|uniref:Uncharacterized protein n=1 Tax=Petrolisthes cinctipes TaxID=88211 RepID=A0AAE1BPI5_PETCI|nr:hypothetical protein Pcinc_040256 [Petrolisthes cinctipes]